MTSIFDGAAVEALRKELALPPALIRRLRNRLFKRFLSDAAAVSGFPESERLEGLNVRINLIPFNPIEHAPHLAGSDRRVIDVFSGSLRRAGLTVTARYSLGADIGAACGQLAFDESRRRRRLAGSSTPSGSA